VNYTWEVALTADRCGMPRENVRYVPVLDGSPYMEVSMEYINDSRVRNSVVQINPLYRFAEEFAHMFDVNLEGHEQTRGLVFDVFMHYITQLDLRQGLSRQEFFLRYFLADLLNGVFGERARESLGSFAKEELRLLLQFILKVYECGSSMTLFTEVIRYIYPGSIVYINNDVVILDKKRRKRSKIRYSCFRICFFQSIMKYICFGNIILESWMWIIQ